MYLLFSLIAKCGWYASMLSYPFALFERFEAQLEKYQGHLTRAAVELAKDWRTDRSLRRLEALLAVADAESSLVITGNGDVIEPENSLIAIGSGGAFAQSAALALVSKEEEKEVKAARSFLPPRSM